MFTVFIFYGKMSNQQENKSWKQIHKDSKELKKKYKEQNLEKKLEKQKQKELLGQIPKQQTVPSKSVSTVSIAVPGSILDNAQSKELRTYLAGQIARAACIFKVDEVIVFDDVGINSINSSANPKRSRAEETNEDGEQIRHCCVQFARILQYLECPQYLRKFFFPLHKDLKFSGLLNPLDAPHHLRQQNDFIYR